MADQGEKLAQALKGLGVELETDEDLENYMLDFLKSTGKIPAAKEKQNLDKGGEAKDPNLQGKAAASQDAGSNRQRPWLSNFSGDSAAKGEVSFDQWKWEVECLIHDALHSSDSIRQAVRKSLKGHAGGIAKRLGPDASTQQILKKLCTVYGTVESGESLLAEFYAATQDKKECVGAWSCRLEDLLDKAEEASQQSSQSPERERVLRSRFWMGLQQQLKDSSRHKFEDKTTSYDELRVEVRQIEHEHKLREKQNKDTRGNSQAQVRMSAAAATAPNEEVEDRDPATNKLEALVNRLSQQFDHMQKEFDNFRERKETNQGPPSQGNKGSSKQKDRNHGDASQDKGNGQSQNSGNSGEPFTCYNCGGVGHLKRDCPSKKVPTCWDCNERGHTKYNCPHSQNLNADKPLSGGRQ